MDTARQPAPTEILSAARALAFGQVYRITFRFPTAFWEENHEFRGAGFVFSQEQFFPTWWTTAPIASPVITGWCAGSAADRLAGQTREQIVEHAMRTLERITKLAAPQPECVYFHDWQDDPFARGAYSYVPAGMLAARRRLAEPVSDILYFAGEATDQNGHSATVHGAMASGRRAAEQILASRRR